MMYQFMQLDDETEIVHSEILEGDVVKVYMEQPIFQGFNSATCYLPTYKWENIEGFTAEQITKLEEIIRSTAHLIIRFASEGGFDNASSF